MLPVYGGRSLANCFVQLSPAQPSGAAATVCLPDNSTRPSQSKAARLHILCVCKRLKIFCWSALHQHVDKDRQSQQLLLWPRQLRQSSQHQRVLSLISKRSDQQSGIFCRCRPSIWPGVASRLAQLKVDVGTKFTSSKQCMTCLLYSVKINHSFIAIPQTSPPAGKCAQCICACRSVC